MLLKHILFINMDAREDRKFHFTAEISKLAPEKEAVERIPAVVPRNGDGALGCTLSHIRALTLAKERGYSQVFICEDDIQFLQPHTLVDSLRKFEANPPTIDWDVLIIGGNNCPPFQPISDYCVRVQNCQTTTGYIVQAHYYDVLISNFKESAEQLMRNPTRRQYFALDIYWKRLQELEDSKWFLLIPLTVTQYANYSNIECRETNYNHLMLDLEKRAWFGIPVASSADSHMKTVVRNSRRGDPHMTDPAYWRGVI